MNKAAGRQTDRQIRRRCSSRNLAKFNHQPMNPCWLLDFGQPPKNSLGFLVLFHGFAQGKKRPTMTLCNSLQSSHIVALQAATSPVVDRETHDLIDWQRWSKIAHNGFWSTNVIVAHHSISHQFPQEGHLQSIVHWIWFTPSPLRQSLSISLLSSIQKIFPPTLSLFLFALWLTITILWYQFGYWGWGCQPTSTLGCFTQAL